jgi:hypothetical protein
VNGWLAACVPCGQEMQEVQEVQEVQELFHRLPATRTGNGVGRFFDGHRCRADEQGASSSVRWSGFLAWRWRRFAV